jgi:hypothetical protein
MKGGYMYLKRYFGLYIKMPGNPTGRRWLDLDSEDKPAASSQRLEAMRSFPNIIVIRIDNLFATSSNRFII